MKLSPVGQLIRVELEARIDCPFYVDEIVQAVSKRISFTNTIEENQIHHTDLPPQAGRNLYFANRYIKNSVRAYLSKKRGHLRAFKSYPLGNGRYIYKHIDAMERSDVDAIIDDYSERIDALARERESWRIVRGKMTETAKQNKKKVYAGSVIADLGWLPAPR